MPDPRLAMDTLRGVLAGEILVQNHCYRADEMANIIDMAKEFGYKVTPSTTPSKATRSPTCSARTASARRMWADWWGFKMEAYDGIQENIPFVHNAGACAIVHSDDPNGIQRPEPGGFQGADLWPARRHPDSR
jgi:imidazolonepropionase-like amidohydrolase